MTDSPSILDIEDTIGSEKKSMGLYMNTFLNIHETYHNI